MKYMFWGFTASMALVLTGCGSLLGRTSYQPKPYPGLRFLADTFPAPVEPGEIVLWIDSPISLVADTLMIPFDLLDATGDEPAPGPKTMKSGKLSQ